VIVARTCRDGEDVAIYDGERYAAFEPRWFDRAHYQDRGAVLHSATGRGGVLMLRQPTETWVLRHYHRGGLVARLIYDHYLWTGLERSRPFREWRLLAHLYGLGLPVPRPVAARVLRVGPIYQADIVTGLITDVQPLSGYLRDGSLSDDRWVAIGVMLGRFHQRGVDHPDLTAHNILLGEGSGESLVDFDNAKIREPGSWREPRLQRLQRSLRKVALETGTQFEARAWRFLREGYDTV
jgi:3-deoxy-D-manno-octulosonic acid kinase